MALDLASARRIEKPAWLNLRTVSGLLLFSLAVLGGQRAMDQARVTTPVWAAARSLVAGSVVGPEDLKLTEVRLEGDALRSYASEGTTLTGAVTTRPIVAGELIPLGALTSSGVTGPGRIMTLPVPPEHSVGGQLAPGDRVDVYATFDSQEPFTILVAPGVEVVDLVQTEALGLSDAPPAGVSVAVPPSYAARLAFALRTGQLDVVKITGDTAGAGPTVIRIEDL
jgi:Flp pilus assembly protein CpaB